MVTAMLLRIHQSGHLAHLDAPAAGQVKEGIRIYKEIIREHIPDACLLRRLTIRSWARCSS
jgi:alpha-galactosidase